MTIAVLWLEGAVLLCTADTRLVAPPIDERTSDIASKIYSIPVAVSAMDRDGLPREPHYRTQYGFAYAGAALPASMTAVTASTLLQHLLRPGDRVDPPMFEDLAEVVRRLAKRYMEESRRLLGYELLFSAGFFGWCPHHERFKVAHIDGRRDFGSFRVELSYPSPPPAEGDPWLVLGSGKEKFHEMLKNYLDTEKHIKSRIPRRVIEQMLVEEADPTVGGAVSIGAAFQGGFQLLYALEPIVKGQPASRRVFNGLDLDTEIGNVGGYIIGAAGLA